MAHKRKVAVKRALEAKSRAKQPKRPTAKKPEKSADERQAEISQLILDHRENGRKLARSILRRWRVRMPAEEIDSIVDLALCEAARRYSSERGASFMTFFFYHLRGHLVRAVARAAQGNNIFLAFARNAGVDTAEWSYLGSETMWSYVPEHLLAGNRDIETPENVMIRQEKISQCQDACAQLDVLEREIIDRSFGEEQPLVDIAKSLGYSRCHISRVKKTALDRLKNLLGNGAAQVEEIDIVDVASEPTYGTDRKVSRRSRRRTIARAAQPTEVCSIEEQQDDEAKAA